MAKKIILAVAVLLVAFLGYVATRNGYFRYERGAVIDAPAERIFPYLSNFELGGQWSPYEKGIEMKKSFSGTPGTAGSVMEFDGEGGTGRLEMKRVEPNSLVEFRLLMTKPFPAENLIRYTLTPEGSGTRFTWSMEGDGGFLGKLISVVIDCEKMIADQMNQGFKNLKELVEAKP